MLVKYEYKKAKVLAKAQAGVTVLSDHYLLHNLYIFVIVFIHSSKFTACG